MAENTTGGPEILEEEPGQGEALFGLARQLKKRIKECAQGNSTVSGEEVIYLWVCVTRSGLQNSAQKTGQAEAMTMGQWLNVVDEAAALGANWLVLSVADALHECPDIWPLGRWAQQIHNMTVGLHLKEGRITREDVTAIKQLDLDKTRLLLRREIADDTEWILKEGVTVWVANPQTDGEQPNCQGPTRMIFVNEKGILYTCGLVEGNDSYRIGHVFDKSLKHIISDPHTPRRVEEDLHVITPECDGCPALIANFFK